MTVAPVRLLFVCTANSCRSQMAEGLARVFGGERVKSFSAGTDPRPVHPLAIRVMAEIEIDISAQESKHIETFASARFDFTITVCDPARQQCPALPGAVQQIHWGFEDPAEMTGDEEQRLKVFRRVRDEIRQRLRLFLLANHIAAREPRS